VPDEAPPDPATESWHTANVRQQVVSQLATGSIAAATEGRMYANTTTNRYEFDTGALIVPGPAWATSGRVGFRLTDATNRSIPNGTSTYTSLTFATEATDTDGFIAAPGTTVTIPADRGGIYMGYALWTWASSPGANSVAQVLANGATALIREPNGSATQSTVCSLTICAALTAGTTLELQLSQGSGGAINVNPTVWEMWRISA
jgi:hypothetical protein